MFEFCLCLLAFTVYIFFFIFLSVIFVFRFRFLFLFFFLNNHFYECFSMFGTMNKNGSKFTIIPFGVRFSSLSFLCLVEFWLADRSRNVQITKTKFSSFFKHSIVRFDSTNRILQTPRKLSRFFSIQLKPYEINYDRE